MILKDLRSICTRLPEAIRTIVYESFLPRLYAYHQGTMWRVSALIDPWYRSTACVIYRVLVCFPRVADTCC